MATTKRSSLNRLLRRYLAMESRRCVSSVIDKAQFRPETVLSVKNREACIKKLKLQQTYLPKEKAREAAVLVPLCTCKGDLGLLYTLRSSKLNSNGGQVSFPGGMKDDTDKNLEQTALRETWEELRIPESKVDVWSSGNFFGRKNLKVMSVFGYIGEVVPEKLEINHHEVEEAFVISLEKLCDPSHFRFTHFRNTFVLPVYTGGKYRVWGLTAAITHTVMSALVPEAYNNKLDMFQFKKDKDKSKSTENEHSRV